MRDSVRQSLSRVVRFVRPLDRRLQTLAVYRAIRRRLSRAYRSNAWASQPDRVVYLREYSTTPVDDSLAVFDSFWGRRVTGNSYAIFLEMFNDPALAHLRFVWVKNDDTDAPAWMYGNDRIRFAAHGSVAYARALLAAKYLVANANFKEYFVRKPDQIFVNPWHGIMLKKLGRDIDQPLEDSAETQRNFNQSSMIALASQWVIETTIGAYGILFGHDRAVETGSPRIDLTLRADADAIRRRLRVPEGKKVLLYAPTWRGDMRAVSNELTPQLAAIEAMSESFGHSHEVYVSLHNYVSNNLGASAAGYRLVPDDLPINEFLAAVDVLVSDYSSIIFDFLVLDRPVVLYVYDLAEYRATRGLYFELQELPVSIATGCDAMLDSIRVGKQPSSFDNYAAAVTKFVPIEDGQASRRVVEAMLDEEGSPGRHDPRIRLLFSAGPLDPGPISDAFLALIHSLNPETFHATVALDAGAVDRSVGRQLTYAQLPEWCEVVSRSGEPFVPGSLRAAYERWLSGHTTVEERLSLDPWLELEARRVFGETTFDVSINFCADSVLWSKLLTLVGARRCITVTGQSF